MERRENKLAALRFQNRLESIESRAGGRNRIRDSDASGGADKGDSKSRGVRIESVKAVNFRETAGAESGRAADDPAGTGSGSRGDAEAENRVARAVDGGRG